MNLDSLAQNITAFFLFAGGLFALLGAIGLARLPDFYMRLHGPAKASTLGVGGVLIGSMVYFSTKSGHSSLHELLITLFLFITAPISAHMVAKVALHMRLPFSNHTRGDPWE